ncbi:hypothetical protein QTO34_014388 [Cnephaeus nilssonii]|uniref:Uncharacterized protein n=1 Tax=Cnephaeus nilssonii TaxID=3371016 RepID=A0AA40I6F4_CNENI|nr:hypothetical protein QTO34_014388 [Eptesicus nilssonii]
MKTFKWDGLLCPRSDHYSTAQRGHTVGTCGALSGMTSPSCLTTAAAKSPRRHLHSLKPSINYLDSMLCCLMQFYQKKLRKSSHDVILSKKMRNISGRINPYRNRGLVTDPNIKKYLTKKNAKMKACLVMKEITNKIKYWTGPLNGEDDRLKQHKSLQMEGQKLSNQSSVMGTEVGRSSTKKQNAMILPSRLTYIFPSGSSIAEHSVFTPIKTSSPIDSTFNLIARRENFLFTLHFQSRFWNAFYLHWADQQLPGFYKKVTL